MVPACPTCPFRRNNVCTKATKPPTSIRNIKECPLDTPLPTKQPTNVSSGKFAAICCYFNPAESKSLEMNYKAFLAHMSFFDIPLYSIHLMFEGQDPIGSPYITLHGTLQENMLWQKEQLLNHLVSNLPPEIEYVAWIDADMLFFDKMWPQRAMHALESVPVCQLWDKWHFTDGYGRTVQTGLSVGDYGVRYLAGTGHPGGAWAAHRSVFPLETTHILGGGDTIAVEAWLGMEDTFLQSQMSPAWKSAWKTWHYAAWKNVRGAVKTLPQEAVHLYHGTRDNRKYGDRSRWLGELNFDPERHIEVKNGILRWTNKAPRSMVELVKTYFTSMRQEDDQLCTQLIG